MKYLIKDQLNKMRKNPFQIIIFSFILMVITGGFVVVKSTIERMEMPLNDYHQSQNTEDFHIEFTPLKFEYLTKEQKFDTVCVELNLFNECTATDEANPESVNQMNLAMANALLEQPETYGLIFDEIIADISLKYNFDYEQSQSIIIEDDRHVLRLSTINQLINLPDIHEGDLPKTLGEVAIFKTYAQANQLEIGDYLQVDGHDFLITGFIYAPDYILPLLKTATPRFDKEKETLVLAVPETLYMLKSPLTIRYHFTGDLSQFYENGNLDISNIMHSDLTQYSRNMNMVRHIMPRDYNVRIQTIELEITTATVFSNVFLTVFMLSGFTMIGLGIKRLIDEQKEDFINLHALGYSPHKLAFSVLTLGFVLSGVIILSFGLALVLSELVFASYTARYLMPKAPLTLTLFTVSIGLILPLIALNIVIYAYGLLFIKRALTGVRVSPKLMWINKFRRLCFNGFLFVLVATLLLFSLSVRNLIDDFRETTMMGNHFENKVFLPLFTDDDIADAETFSTATLTMYQVNDTVLRDRPTLYGYGLDVDASMKRLIDDNQANNQRLSEGIIVTAYTANLYDIGVGDTVTLGYRSTRITQEIVGINNDLIENAVYMSHSNMNDLLGYGEAYYNGYFTNQTTIDTTAYRIINYERIADDIALLFNLSNRIVYGLMSLAVVVAMMMFYFLTMTALLEVLPVYYTLRALGYRHKETFLMFFKTIVIYLGIAYILAVFIVNIALNILSNYLETSLGFMFTSTLSLWHVLISFLIIAFMVSLITQIVYVNMNKADLSTGLKKA